MAFCRTFLTIFFLLNALWSAEIPQTIQYQGRFLDAATNQPVAGVVTKQLNFNIRKVELGNVPGQIIFAHTANNVSIRDGIFNVEIPVPSSVSFDSPYGIEVIVQGSGGGNVGFQPFRSVPYAITAKNALSLGGISASEYALTTHVHTQAGGKSFLVDGTGSNLLADDAQFTIINGDGQEVFRVNASGDLQRVNRINASGAIETNSSLRVTDEKEEDVFVADQNGNVRITGDLTVSGSSTVGSLEVSGLAILDSIFVNNTLTFGSNASINAIPENGVNIIGEAHSFEDHASSDLLSKLESLTNGSVVSAALHSHSLGPNDITSTSIKSGSIFSRHIADGTISNADIALNAAIDDSKLATISTPGKITTAALPSDVALKNVNNIFGAGFSPGGIATLATLNSFDEVLAKNLSIISTSSAIGSQFVQIQDFNARFRWLVDGDGTVQFKRVHPTEGEQTRIEIKTESNKTFIRLRDVVFTGDEDMISGDIIADGTILAADLADNSITSDKIIDGAVTTNKIQDGAITEALIAPEAVTADKLEDGSITTTKLAPNSVTTDKVDNLSLTADKIQDGAITALQIQDNAITAALIADNEISSSKIAPNAIESSNIKDSTLSGSKIADGAIGNVNLQNDVLIDRKQPMSITLTSDTTPHITLESSATDAQFIKMTYTIDSTNKQFPGVLLAEVSGKQSISLNLDGSMSMKSEKLSKAVTVLPEVFATMLGITATGSLCPVNSAYKLVVPPDADISGTGFCFSHFNTDSKTYKEAMLECEGQGARLCSVGEIRQACQGQHLNANGDIMSSDLAMSATTSDIFYLQLNVSDTNQKCAASGNYDIGAENINTGGRYACCINP